MSASGMPVTLVSGKLKRILEGTDSLYVQSIAPSETDAHLTVTANGDGELKLGTVEKITRVLGDLYVDGAETITGGATFNGAVTLGDNSGDAIAIGGGTSDSSTLACDLTVNNAVDIRYARATGSGVLVLPDNSTGEAGAVRVNSSNEFQWWDGASWATAGTSSTSTWQAVYEAGSTLVTNVTGGTASVTVSTSGDFDILNGTDSFTFDYLAANQLAVTGVVETWTVDSAAGTSIGAGAASDFTTTAGALTLDGAGGVNIVGNAAEVDITTTGAVDINSAAGTWDSSAGIAFEAATDSIWNVTTGNLTLSTTSTGELDLTSAGLMDINAGANLDIDVTGTTNLLSTSTIAIAGTGVSSWTTTTGGFTLQTVTSGTLAITAIALLDINAGANLDIDVTGTYNMLSTGTYTVAATGASSTTITSGNYTIATATSGNLILDAAGGDLTFDDSHYTGDGTFGPTGSMPFSTAGVTDLTFAATCLLDAINIAYASAGGVGTWTEVADEIIATNDIVAADDTAAQGKVVKANSGTANQNFVIGVCTAGAAAGAAVSIQCAGKITVKTSDAGAWTVGAPVYMCSTDGEVTNVPVTTGVSQRVGYSLDTGTAGTRSICLSIGEPVEM